MEFENENGNDGMIKSVQKSLKILKYIVDSDVERSLTDIEKSLGYNISTVHRLMKTMMKEGFISQNKTTKKYDIGPEMFFSLLDAKKSESYFNRVKPILEECVKVTGETTNLFIRDNDEAVCITGCESPQTLKAFLKIGRRIPLFCTAAGKAFIAYLKDEDVKNILYNTDLKEYLPNTLTNVESILQELKISRERGYTTEVNEFEKMVSVVGVPVFDSKGRVVCTISTIAPSTRVDENIIPVLAQELKIASERITEAMEKVIY